MSSDNLGALSSIDAVGADAVCAQCGTVNPEGTFICRKCGNNLRDQRLIRMQAEQAMQGGAETAEVSRYQFTSILAAVGLVLILLVTFNVDRVSRWLVSTQDTTVNTARLPWSGPDAALFDALAASAAAASIDEAAANLAKANAVYAPPASGTYAVFYNDAHAGTAQVAVEGDDVHFAATLSAGTQLRGHARLQEKSIVMSWGGGGMLHYGEYYSAAGTAVAQDDGSIECFGRTELNDENYEFSLYRAAKP